MNKKENYLYKITLATQIGKKNGNLFLSVENNKIDGFLEILDSRQDITGVVTVDGCVFKGQLKTLVSVYDYIAEGHFDEQSVSFVLKYKYGTFRLTGMCTEYTTENR